ncbi:MAG TPA: hypothetical protein VGG75_39520 [Trebonia sp.]|jgi:hypothetical protein
MRRRRKRALALDRADGDHHVFRDVASTSMCSVADSAGVSRSGSMSSGTMTAFRGNPAGGSRSTTNVTASRVVPDRIMARMLAMPP